MTEPAYRLVIAPSAERALARLPARAAAAVVEFMLGPLVEAPQRVGHPLQRELTGLLAAPRGPYRVMYEIDHDKCIVSVLRIDHRSDVAMTLRLTDDEQAALRQRARREGISMQDAARRAVRDYIARGEHRDRVRVAAERVAAAHADALQRLGE